MENNNENYNNGSHPPRASSAVATTSTTHTTITLAPALCSAKILDAADILTGLRKAVPDGATQEKFGPTILSTITTTATTTSMVNYKENENYNNRSHQPPDDLVGEVTQMGTILRIGIQPDLFLLRLWLWPLLLPSLTM